MVLDLEVTPKKAKSAKLTAANLELLEGSPTAPPSEDDRMSVNAPTDVGTLLTNCPKNLADKAEYWAELNNPYDILNEVPLGRQHKEGLDILPKLLKDPNLSRQSESFC